MNLLDNRHEDMLPSDEGYKLSISSEELNLLPLKTFEGKVSVITEVDKL
jgi:hypothetical protein